MKQPLSSRCLRGHPRTVENTRVDRTGFRHCRECDRLRKAGELSSLKAQVAETSSRVGELEKELEFLRKEYEANPRSWQLSEQVGFAEQRLIYERTKDAREAEKQVTAAEHIAFVEAERSRSAWSNGEWADRLPPHCPKCGGWSSNSRQTEALPCAGYTRRIGDFDGASCAICRHQWFITREGN